MASNDQDITIKINVDDSGVVKVLKATGEQVESLGGKTENTNEGFSKFQATLITLNQALDLGGKVFSFLNNQLERAAVVERVSTAFDTLQGSSSLASQELEDLRIATKGLVSDFDLMKQANQAVSLGLPKEEFDELAGAAVKLGAKVGQDAVGSIESLIAAVGRSSPLMLDNLGIKLKAAEAEEIYAAKLNKATDQLTEQEKALAFQQSAIIKIREAAAELGDVTNTGATSYQQFTTSVTNATDALTQLVSNSQIIKDFFKGLSFLVDESADFIRVWAQELKDASDAANGVRAAQIRQEIRDLNKELSQSEAAKFGADLNLALKPERLSQIGQRLNFLHLELGNLTEQQKKSTKVTNENSGSLSKNADAQKELEKAIDESRKRSEEWVDFQLAQADATLALVKEDEKYIQVLDDLKSGFIDSEEAGQRFNQIIADQEAESKLAERASQLLAEAIAGIGDGATITEAQLGELLKQVDKLESKGKESGSFLNFLGLSSDALPINPIQIDFNIEGASKDLNAVFDDINFAADVLQSDSIEAGISKIVGKSIENLGKIGQGTKETISGLIGAIAPINFGLDDAIGGLFDSENAGKLARDKVDAYFEDLLDKDRVFLIIDGQLQEIKDLAENEFTGFFGNLDTSTETGLAQFGGFDAIGLALENMFQVTDDISGQMGAVLANNVGGSLNNLQLLFQQLGIAQGDLGQAIEEAYLDGQISATQFLETSRQIENVYAKGIPDGLGRTDLALLNIIESGGAGRQLLDGLIDLAVEAKEKQDENITSLEDLKESLIASGEDAEKVTQLFDAIGQAGITSLEQLSDISINTAAVIGSNLESIDGFFADTSEKVEVLQKKLDQLQDKEIELRFNVKTTLDSTTRDNQALIQEGLGGDFNLGGIQ